MKSLNNYISEKLVINKNFVGLPTWNTIDTLISIIFNSANWCFYIICYKKCSESTTEVSKHKITIDHWKIALREDESTYKTGTYKIAENYFLYEEDGGFFTVILEPNIYGEKIKSFIEKTGYNERCHYKDILGHFDIDIDEYTGFFNRTREEFHFKNDKLDDEGVLRNIIN